MFCLLCRKHNLKSRRSKSDVWYTTPSVQLRREAVQDHLTTTQHKEAIKLEMMQRVSTFQKQVNEKHEVNENVLEKTFTAIYWLAKRISNQKLIPLLKAHSNGVGALYSLLPRAVDGGTRLFQASRSNLNLARSPTMTRKFLATCFPRTYQAWQKTSPVASMIACPF